MKRAMLAVLAVLLSANLAFAWSFADNDQTQIQNDGGFAIAGPPGAAGIGGAGSVQQGDGFVIAEPGDYASETQSQSQILNDGYGAGFGPNGHGGAWTVEQNQASFSETGGGIAGNWQAQGIVGGSAGLTVGGQFGVAGSAGLAGGVSASGALGASQSFNEQDQRFVGTYGQQSVSPNGGYVNQTGFQDFGTETASGAFIAGAGIGAAGVVQAGGSVVQNDGQGTAMTGAATAAGEAVAVSGGVGIGGGAAEAYGYQEHSYEQYNTSADGTSQQIATGTVTTFVQASD